MTERASHLMDHVLPADVQVRQCVLSVPHRLRYRLAYHHRLCRTVLHVFVRALRSAARTVTARVGDTVSVVRGQIDLTVPAVTRGSPEGWVRRHPSGTTETIHYDPTDPERISLVGVDDDVSTKTPAAYVPGRCDLRLDRRRPAGRGRPRAPPSGAAAVKAVTKRARANSVSHRHGNPWTPANRFRFPP
jgi:hypothetical protein